MFGSRLIFAALILTIVAVPLWSQENYEIQVYPSETVAKGATMVELHSNFTFQGSKDDCGRRAPPTTPCMRRSRSRTASTTGSKPASTSSPAPTRARLAVGRRPHPPAGADPAVLEMAGRRQPVDEIGWARPCYSADTWTWEIRPIIDKKIGKLYLSFNPSLDRSFHGPGVKEALNFPQLQSRATTSPRRSTRGSNTTERWAR